MGQQRRIVLLNNDCYKNLQGSFGSPFIMPTSQAGALQITSSDADTAVMAIDLATGASVGEHWVAELSHDANVARTWPAGWTQIFDFTGTAANGISTEARYIEISAGNVSDTQIVVSAAGAESYIAFCRRLEGMASATGAGNGVISTANPDPPLVSASGYQITYAITGFSAKRGSTPVSATAPTDFVIDGATATGGANGMTGGTADDDIASASSVDPGTWGHGLGNRQSIAYTMIFEDATASAPAGGLSIPLAMANYRIRRTGNLSN